MEVLEHSIRENEILEDEMPKDDYKDDERLPVLLNSASLYIAKETMFAMAFRLVVICLVQCIHTQ